MANQLEKFYSGRGGLDTRTNKLTQNPNMFRNGSKNWKYNQLDELTKANGWQHKTSNDEHASRGLIESKRLDVNTGEAIVETLGVDDNGVLWVKKYHALKFSPTTPGDSLIYSFYYDEKANKFFLSVPDGKVEVTQTMTMAQLVTALNAVLTTGTVAVYDQSGVAVVGSTQLAYLGNVVISSEVDSSDLFQQSWYWSRVLTPTLAEVCFPVTAEFKDSDEYEGISYININNSTYMTDGGFVIKYDGFSAYRAGMPRTYGLYTGAESPDGFDLAASTGGSMTPTSVYNYKFQYFFVDPNGVEILGKITNPLFVTLGGANNAVNISIPAIKNTQMFPVYGCKVSVAATLDNANQTFVVNSGHNVVAGMSLRLPVYDTTIVTPVLGWTFWIATVTAVTATTITVQAPPINTLRYMDPAGKVPANTVVSGQWISAGYTQDIYKNKITALAPNGGSYWQTDIVFGAGVRVFRSGANDELYQRCFDAPLLYFDSNKYVIKDTLPDTGLNGRSSIALSPDEGEELPRACKYLSIWQNTIIQSGRPVDPTVKDDLYPTVYDVSTASLGPYGASTINNFFIPLYYTESHLCDFSSIYWNSEFNPEGFPQDGLHEFLIDTPKNDRVTGMAPNKDAFFVFKQFNTGLLTGDLIGQNISMEILEANVGCISHRSVKDINGSLIWLDGTNGFFSCVAGRLPVPIGYPISDYQTLNSQGLDYKKAVSANYTKESLYVCAVESTTFVFDYRQLETGIRGIWYLWDRFNTRAILATSNNELLLSDGSRVWQMKTTNTKYDLTDHTSAIDFNPIIAWQNLKNPIIKKHFLNIWINSIQGGFCLEVNQYYNYMDTERADICKVNFLSEDDCKAAIKEPIKLNQEKLDAISIGFRNNDKNAFVRIQGYELQLSPDYDKAEPER